MSEHSHLSGLDNVSDEMVAAWRLDAMPGGRVRDQRSPWAGWIGFADVLVAITGVVVHGDEAGV